MELARLIAQIFKAWDTPFTMPYVGTTSFFKITIILAALGILVDFIGSLIGGKKE